MGTPEGVGEPAGLPLVGAGTSARPVCPAGARPSPQHIPPQEVLPRGLREPDRRLVRAVTLLSF